MKFAFHAWNHTEAGKRSLEDIIKIVSFQLRACGHWTVWDPDNDAKVTRGEPIYFCHGPGEYNVIVEGFTPHTTALIARAHQELGARFICLATEEPTEKGFNHGTQPEMVMRQETFPAAMRYFDGILHLVPGQRVTDWYSQFAPTAYVELGYASQLLRPERNPNPKFEFGFFGSMTKRRHHLLLRLFRRMGKPPNAVRLVQEFLPDAERDAIMQDCKVILQIRKFDEMALVSSSRCNTALCLGRPVVAEPHGDLALSKPWDEIVKFTSSEQEFFDTAILTARRWRDAHYFQFERFKKKLTPQVCVGDAVTSLRLGEPRARAA